MKSRLIFIHNSAESHPRRPLVVIVTRVPIHLKMCIFACSFNPAFRVAHSTLAQVRSEAARVPADPSGCQYPQLEAAETKCGSGRGARLRGRAAEGRRHGTFFRAPHRVTHEPGGLHASTRTARGGLPSAARACVAAGRWLTLETGTE